MLFSDFREIRSATTFLAATNRVKSKIARNIVITRLKNKNLRWPKSRQYHCLNETVISNPNLLAILILI